MKRTLLLLFTILVMLLAITSSALGCTYYKDLGCHGPCGQPEGHSSVLGGLFGGQGQAPTVSSSRWPGNVPAGTGQKCTRMYSDRTGIPVCSCQRYWGRLWQSAFALIKGQGGQPQSQPQYQTPAINAPPHH